MTDDGRIMAARVLERALQWRLAPGRWGVVAGILDLVVAAVDAGDDEALRDAAERLDEAGSGRFTRIGSTPTQPPPNEVRERVVALVESLTGFGPAKRPVRRWPDLPRRREAGDGSRQ